MPRLNRGKIQRVSIKLSGEAKKRIMDTARNLKVSQASMIMYGLSEQMKEQITQEQMLNLKNRIILEQEYFAVSMPKHLTDRVEIYINNFKFKKGEFIGLLVSDYFEKLKKEKWTDIEGETKKLTLPLHRRLKEKVYQYAEENYLNVGFLITKSIENGKYEGLPGLPEDEKELVTYNLPEHIYQDALKQSTELGVPLHFYIESCIYNAFIDKNKIF